MVAKAALSSRCAKAASQGLDVLAALQRCDGSFPTHVAHRKDMAGSREVPSPFATAMVVSSLQGLTGADGVAGLLAKALDHLEGWRSGEGWVCFLREGIDPDLDDTCLVNGALGDVRPAGFSYRRLADRVASLRREDGGFPTWLRGPGGDPNDVDPCVVVNVVRFLTRWRPEPRAPFLRGALDEWHATVGTLYYASPFAFPYLLSRLPEPCFAVVVGGEPPGGARLTAAPPRTALDQAMQLTALTKWASVAAVRRSAELLLERQEPEGGWPCEPAFRGFGLWGSAALTTALAVESLHAARCRLEW